MSPIVRQFNRKDDLGIDVFNDMLAKAARDDFVSLPFIERLKTVETLQTFIYADEVFAIPSIGALMRFGGDAHIAIRERVVYAAGDAAWKYDSAADRGMDLLVCFRDDDCAAVRASIVKLAGVLACRWDGLENRVLSLMDCMKSDESPVVRADVVNALGLIGQKDRSCAEGAREILLAMKHDGKADIAAAIDFRLAEIRAAEERDFEPPEPNKRGYDLG